MVQDRSIVHLHGDDDVVIALKDLPANFAIGEVITKAAIQRGHKIAINPVRCGKTVRRYGQMIGVATQDIQPGEHVHSHNLGMGDHRQDYSFGQDVVPLSDVAENLTFQGYHRPDGQVGTRNYLGILTTVNCSGSVARFIAEAAEKTDWLAQSGIDGIVPIVHGSGCGMSGQNEGYATLYRTLAGYARNPNFAGILLVGLGCEVMQVADLVGRGKLRADGLYRYMTIQNKGGTRRTIEAGLEHLRDMAKEAGKIARQPAPVSALTIGMQCGGSDGYSGITANPALGCASDLLVQHGGTSILSETPEIYGAEHLLTRRALSNDIGEKLIERIRWWEDYTVRNGNEIDNNPSPGNKRGGLTTILEKSLGAVAKGGRAPLAGVYEFAERVDCKGFVFMDSPGYDPCSVTGQIASGANLIIFTTGRGSVSGYKPVPCIKLATNSEMYDRMSEDMDLNCGDIVSNGISLQDKGQEIFEMMIKVASGTQTKSEELGFGGAEFVPWQIGAVM